MQENPTHFIGLYPWSFESYWWYSNVWSLWNPSPIFTFATYQLHSSEEMESWQYARESKEEIIFPKSGGHAQSTSLDRGRRSSTHGYTVPWEGRKESTVKWGSDSLKTNPSTSYFALSLCIVFLLSFSLHIYQSRYIHILMRK